MTQFQQSSQCISESDVEVWSVSQSYTKTELMLFNGMTVSESYLEMQKEKQAMIPAIRIFVGYFE